MSLNRWNYVGGNPVNLADPSGNFPPIWCQAMTSKAMYEGCVDVFYGIEPINIAQIGEEFVTGERGCYKGPSAYRAPGYIEGTGLTLANTINVMFAAESVYDFATMEHSYFVNGAFDLPGIPGVGVSDFLWGITSTEYAGYVYGLKSNLSIHTAYSGAFVVGYIGASAGQQVVDFLGYSVGIGKTGFVSPGDPLVRGSANYISAGFGLDPLPIVDGGIGIISSVPASTIDYYQEKNNVQKERLFSDILYARHNVWISRFGPLYFSSVDINSRLKAAIKSLWYGIAYEDLHDEIK